MSMRNCGHLFKQCQLNSISKTQQSLAYSGLNNLNNAESRRHINTDTSLSKKQSSNKLQCVNSSINLITRRNVNTVGKILRPHVDPKLSYAFSRSAEDLVYTTIGREFSKKVAEAPDDYAFACDSENKVVTFKQLSEDVNKLIKALITKFDIKKGDFVGVFAYNCYNWIVIQYACSKLGAILTPINPSYKSHELEYVLKKGKIKCLFMPGPKSIQEELNNHIGVLHSDEIIQMSRNKDLKLEHVVLMDSENDYGKLSETITFKLSNCELVDWTSTETDGQVFSSLNDAESAGFQEEDNPIILDPDHQVSPDDLFAVYYTSGTTGKPKGACLSQFTVMNNVRFCQFRIRNGRPRNFRIISGTTLPMFHIFAGVLNVLGPIVSNSMIVFPSHKYDIEAFINSIIRHQANTTVLTPTMLIDLLAYIEKHKVQDLPLKMIQPGGASLPPELVTRTFKILPNLEELRCGYGSTENGSISTFQTIHEPLDVKNYTVGPPIDYTEVRIVEAKQQASKSNNDIFRVLPLGQVGEIQTRGHNTMIEYLDDPEKTREVMTPSNWYRTGDIGFMHPHGSIQINGRLKHMIIKGGENIYPEEVEQIIYKLNYVEAVHVIGVPDKRFGEQVCAWIKLKSGFKVSSSNKNKQDNEIHQDDITNFCKDNITYFKVPKYILFVDEFPMTPTKKAQNHIMIEQSIKRLGLDKELSES